MGFSTRVTDEGVHSWDAYQTDPTRLTWNLVRCAEVHLQPVPRCEGTRSGPLPYKTRNGWIASGHVLRTVIELRTLVPAG